MTRDELLDFDGERGHRTDPLPKMAFEDFDSGAMVPVPRYAGAISWVFPESSRPRGDRQ